MIRAVNYYSSRCHHLGAKKSFLSPTTTPCGRRYKSTAAAVGADDESNSKSNADHPTLVRVPSLPVVGSLIPQYSGIPIPFKPEMAFDFWPAMKAKFGDFYELGIPGLGAGIKGSTYVIQDPNEMAAVLRSEGKYPHGAAESAWPFKIFNVEHNQRVGGIIEHGPEWLRMRRFLQSDLLSPQAAARYVPAILEAAHFASKGAPAFAEQNKLNEYLNLASFDLFSNVMMGFLPRVSDPNESSDPQDRAFCDNVAKGLRLGTLISRTPMENLFINVFKMKTPKYKEYEKAWKQAVDTSQQKAEELYQRRSGNQLSEREEDSYANQAFARQAAEENNSPENKEFHITLEETKQMAGALLSAGVDTTGNMLTWKMLHLSSSPEAQDKLYHELQPTLVDGKLTRESLAIPYLTQFLRESHRLGNPTITVPMKKFAHVGPRVHGLDLPKGSVVMLDGYSTGMQQEHFEDPVTDFVPERFSKEAINARKGTPHQIVDHSFFNGPFSQGARKCPGSRVANLEAHALIAQWCLDWKMALPSSVGHFLEVPYGMETLNTAYLPAIEFTPR